MFISAHLWSFFGHVKQKWPRIWSSGVDSGRILRIFGARVKFCEKSGPGSGVFIFGSSRSLGGLMNVIA